MCNVLSFPAPKPTGKKPARFGKPKAGKKVAKPQTQRQLQKELTEIKGVLARCETWLEVAQEDMAKLNARCGDLEDLLNAANPTTKTGRPSGVARRSRRYSVPT